jgi:hypothetical protein
MKTKKSNYKKVLLFLVIVVATTTMLIPFSVIAVNSNYISNQVPLIDTPFVPLPLGSIRATGWLNNELMMQKNGLTGYGADIYGNEINPNNGWAGGVWGTSSGEALPYYLKGLVALAYTLNDADLKSKAQWWIDTIIARQQSDGYIGPLGQDTMPNAADWFWWQRMPVTYMMRDYYDATGDARVLTFLDKYYTYMTNKLPSLPLGSVWGGARVGDEIDTVIWLYNRTGKSYLMNLVQTLHDQGFNWSDICTNNLFDSYTDDMHSHGVNVGQALKFPPAWYQKSNSAFDRDAFTKGINNLSNSCGRVDGNYSGTELLTNLSTTEGVETCTNVEPCFPARRE